MTELLSRGSLEDVIRRGGLRTASYGLILDLALQVGRVPVFFCACCVVTCRPCFFLSPLSPGLCSRRCLTRDTSLPPDDKFSARRIPRSGWDALCRCRALRVVRLELEHCIGVRTVSAACG